LLGTQQPASGVGKDQPEEERKTHISDLIG
jgi:hypothetical protein